MRNHWLVLWVLLMLPDILRCPGQAAVGNGASSLMMIGSLGSLGLLPSMPSGGSSFGLPHLSQVFARPGDTAGHDAPTTTPEGSSALGSTSRIPGVLSASRQPKVPRLEYIFDGGWGSGCRRREGAASADTAAAQAHSARRAEQ